MSNGCRRHSYPRHTALSTRNLEGHACWVKGQHKILNLVFIIIGGFKGNAADEAFI